MPADFGSAGKSGEEAGDTGETMVSTMGFLTSLDSYSGVGRRTMGWADGMLGSGLVGLTVED